MKIYVVIASPEYGLPRISGEAYKSLQGAQKFIESRSDMPKQLTPFSYKGRTQSYLIHELTLR